MQLNLLLSVEFSSDLLFKWIQLCFRVVQMSIGLVIEQNLSVSVQIKFLYGLRCIKIIVSLFSLPKQPDFLLRQQGMPMPYVLKALKLILRLRFSLLPK